MILLHLLLRRTLPLKVILISYAKTDASFVGMTKFTCCHPDEGGVWTTFMCLCVPIFHEWLYVPTLRGSKQSALLFVIRICGGQEIASGDPRNDAQWYKVQECDASKAPQWFSAGYIIIFLSTKHKNLDLIYLLLYLCTWQQEIIPLFPVQQSKDFLGKV